MDNPFGYTVRRNASLMRFAPAFDAQLDSASLAELKELLASQLFNPKSDGEYKRTLWLLHSAYLNQTGDTTFLEELWNKTVHNRDMMLAILGDVAPEDSPVVAFGLDCVKTMERDYSTTVGLSTDQELAVIIAARFLQSCITDRAVRGYVIAQLDQTLCGCRSDKLFSKYVDYFYYSLARIQRKDGYGFSEFGFSINSSFERMAELVRALEAIGYKVEVVPYGTREKRD